MSDRKPQPVRFMISEHDLEELGQWLVYEIECLEEAAPITAKTWAALPLASGKVIEFKAFKD